MSYEKLIILILEFRESITIHLMNRSIYSEDYRQGVENREIILCGNEPNS